MLRSACTLTCKHDTEALPQDSQIGPYHSTHPCLTEGPLARGLPIYEGYWESELWLSEHGLAHLSLADPPPLPGSLTFGALSGEDTTTVQG